MHRVANQQFKTCVTIDVIVFCALNHFQMDTFEIFHVFISFIRRLLYSTNNHWIVDDIGFRFEIQMIPVCILHRFNNLFPKLIYLRNIYHTE